MLLAILFILGAHVGSFLNVCIWRMPRGESVMEPPSHCPKCNTRLRPMDLVPILSQLFLGSRCRYCKSPYSWRYGSIEALTGVLFVLAGMRTGLIEGGLLTGALTQNSYLLAILLRDLVVISCLVVVFFIDLETFMIPLTAPLLIGLAGVGADLWGLWVGAKQPTVAPLGFFDAVSAPIPESLAAMVLSASLIWALRAVATKLYGQEAMGFGDVVLVAGIGANIGWNVGILAFFFLSAVLGAFIGLAMRIPYAVRAYRRGRARDARESNRAREGASGRQNSAPRRRPVALALVRHAFRLEIPFGPMLAVGAFATILYGSWLTDSYAGWANLEAGAAPASTVPAGP